MKWLIIMLSISLLPCLDVRGQGLLRTLDTFRKDFSDVKPAFPVIGKERVTYSCFQERDGIFGDYLVRYSFQKAPQEQDMPCVAIIVETSSSDGGGKMFVRKKLIEHAREVWGKALVERGGFGVPGRTVVEYHLKDSKVTCFRIIQEELNRPGLAGLTRFTAEAERYKPSLFNKARIK